MAVSRQQMSQWFDNGQAANQDFMLVVCDTFDYEDYPVYAQRANVHEKLNAYNGVNMQRILEVYDLRGNKESQLNNGGIGLASIKSNTAQAVIKARICHGCARAFIPTEDFVLAVNCPHCKQKSALLSMGVKMEERDDNIFNHSLKGRIELAAAVAKIQFVAQELSKADLSDADKFRLAWELANVHLRNLEDFRQPS